MKNQHRMVDMIKRLTAFVLMLALTLGSFPMQAFAAGASDVQVTNKGGNTSNTTDNVTVSKTIEGTGIENVFDITLKVTTKTNIDTITKDPDTAIVVVMDISNSMKSEFPEGSGKTRYTAAIAAAKQFINDYRTDVGSKSQTSKIGFVAFNTDAKQIAAMTTVKTTAQATAFKNTVQNGCDAIIYDDGYDTSHKRFTNIQAGLKRGYDMIKDLPNQNKYIVFLSDGFPTTYIKSGYTGYDPYTPGATSYTEGQFYDAKEKLPCTYGTSYSDRAAVKARQQATAIKNAGANIFSIGIDVGGQTITGYDIYHRSAGDKFSVIDRANSTSYEIGSASSTSAFKSWLKGSASNNTTGIGSGYYYDSTNQAGIDRAFASIAEEMKAKTAERAAKAWQVSDPMGANAEFIGFYDMNNTLQATGTNLSGSWGAAKENTASYTSSSKTFNWNLQKSGYSLSSGTYTYTLKYRVRLTNEVTSFVEGTSYDTNGDTKLTYNVITTVDGNPTISPNKTITFKKPTVKGYLGELTFTKKDDYGNPVQGAVFTLTHACAASDNCKGTATPAKVANNGNLAARTATSGADGKVTFTNIPSGHKYNLVETTAPHGYDKDNTTYHVTVSFDKLTQDIKNGVVVNPVTPYDLTINKVNAATKQPLEGAHFTLYSDAALKTRAKHPDGTDVADLISNTQGKANIGLLKNGTYYLVETQSPEGFTLPTGAIVITIDNTNTKNPVTAQQGTAKLTVEADLTTLKFGITVPNNPGVTLPKTGGPGTAIFTITGAALCAAALVTFEVISRRRQRREVA